MKFIIITGFFIAIVSLHSAYSEVPKLIDKMPHVKVNKCCRKKEIYIGKHCVLTNTTTEEWKPLFVTEKGVSNVQVNYELIIGLPDCGHMQRWPIYHYINSTDKLRLLPNGILRHYFDHTGVNELDIDSENAKVPYHDYEQGKYCLDKKEDGVKSDFAWVCAPDVNKDWLTNTEFLMYNVVNPITHGISMLCLLIVAIIYFVMPTLRDLTGNIITTICMCLIVSQTADMIRLLTVFKNHISLIITETICYISMLAAFFWLNSLAYYIWKTFKSRNVFLRITDGKKYCYYSGYAWSCTILLGVMAVFAHFTMDYPDVNLPPKNTYEEEREQIGSLGIIIFFVPVSFTILADMFFFATTLKKINKMHTYGRIHHKLRHTFRMFVLLLMVMVLQWLFFLSSFSKYEGLVNAYIFINTFEGPLLLYVCIFNQRHVAYLIQKTCCYTTCPCCIRNPEVEWGDEMTAMNTLNNY
ncbi:probable G-protein coupled receptor Mth-like 5 isoform X1 [Diorhabda carinulata]|uniref:probable G-protein coupled receptor Mth-like 5 isoform X1 n=1 Tax=Diorhabda carinulata TaxID=1163345 RepID=UPI0025A149A8|nr:probable G-protein coupled receptor Mth-like 5 isoform X1 [Diorhabda carinulata]